jgi:hypothetical protein
MAGFARRLVGQSIAICASKRRDVEAFRDILEGCFGFGFDAKTECPYATMGAFPLGAVVGVATLDRVFGPGEELTADEARFYIGKDLMQDGNTFGLSFSDRRHIEPIAVSGALGFWTLPTDVAARMEAGPK